MSASFREKVLRVVARIPKGSVMTYKDVAEHVGHSGAARAVGTVIRSNYDDRIPCHRVVRSDGSPGRYNRGDGRKVELLRKEGVV